MDSTEGTSETGMWVSTIFFYTVSSYRNYGKSCKNRSSVLFVTEYFDLIYRKIFLKPFFYATTGSVSSVMGRLLICIAPVMGNK